MSGVPADGCEFMPPFMVTPPVWCESCFRQRLPLDRSRTMASRRQNERGPDAPYWLHPGPGLLSWCSGYIWRGLIFERPGLCKTDAHQHFSRKHPNCAGLLLDSACARSRYWLKIGSRRRTARRQRTRRPRWQASTRSGKAPASFPAVPWSKAWPNMAAWKTPGARLRAGGACGLYRSVALPVSKVCDSWRACVCRVPAPKSASGCESCFPPNRRQGRAKKA
jgi:hypothetical protein